MSMLAIRERLKKILPTEGYAARKIIAVDTRIGNFFAWISHRDLSITQLPSTIVQDYVDALRKQGVALDEVDATVFALALLFKYAPQIDGQFNAMGVVIPTTTDLHAQRAALRSPILQSSNPVRPNLQSSNLQSGAPQSGAPQSGAPQSGAPQSGAPQSPPPQASPTPIGIDLVGASEAARILQVNRTYVRALAEAGELPVVQQRETAMGTVRMFDRRAVLALRGKRAARGSWTGRAFEKIVETSAQGPEAATPTPPLAILPFVATLPPSIVEAVVAIKALKLSDLTALNKELKPFGFELVVDIE